MLKIDEEKGEGFIQGKLVKGAVDCVSCACVFCFPLSHDQSKKRVLSAYAEAAPPSFAKAAIQALREGV
jgi:hypothetical protein